MITRRDMATGSIALAASTIPALAQETKRDIVDRILCTGMVMDMNDVPERGRVLVLSMEDALELYNWHPYTINPIYKEPTPGGRMGMVDRFTILVSAEEFITVEKKN